MGNNDRLKYRMYFFVPYNLSPIQQAIQAGHAALEYTLKYMYITNYGVISADESKRLKDFITYDKTWIILNGGTTNSGHFGSPFGSMQQIYEQIKDNGIPYAIFNEPDLNSAMTAICFLVDERVYDYENYPDIMDYAKDKMEKIPWLETFKNGPWTYAIIKESLPTIYATWQESLGGEKNVFLRELLKGKKLA